MKKILATFVLAIFSLMGAISLPVPSVMAIKCPAGTVGANEERNSLAECDITIGEKESKKVSNRIGDAISLVVAMVGVVTVVVIIIGGIQYVTSQGDAGKTVKARNTILYGIVGLVICLLAYAIVNFVLTGVFG